MGQFTDDSLPLAQTLVAGISGSGKTEFALRYLRYHPACACRFIFDDMGVASRKLGISPAMTASQLEDALPRRWVVFNHTRMFPPGGQYEADGKTVDALTAGFRFFCNWVYEASQRGPGKKLVLVDELWRHCTPNYVPPWLALIAQTARNENVELVTATQRPNLINESITGQSTEIVCFRLQAPLGVAKMVKLTDGRLSAPEIMGRPNYKFISLNTLSGQILRN